MCSEASPSPRPAVSPVCMDPRARPFGGVGMVGTQAGRVWRLPGRLSCACAHVWEGPEGGGVLLTVANTVLNTRAMALRGRSSSHRVYCVRAAANIMAPIIILRSR